MILLALFASLGRFICVQIFIYRYIYYIHINWLLFVIINDLCTGVVHFHLHFLLSSKVFRKQCIQKRKEIGNDGDKVIPTLKRTKEPEGNENIGDEVYPARAMKEQPRRLGKHGDEVNLALMRKNRPDENRNRLILTDTRPNSPRCFSGR